MLSPTRPNAPTTTQVRRYSQLPRFFRWFSNQCVLRQLDESDAERVLGAVTDPGFGRCATGAAPLDPVAVARALQQSRNDWGRGVRYSLAVLRKLTHEFVGWIEVRPAGEKGCWTIDAFFHPDFVDTAFADEALHATADLMFSALETAKLYARAPVGNRRIEDLLNAAGFIELAGAGTPDPATGRHRTHGLYELGLADWNTMRGATVRGASDDGITAQWATSGLKLKLELSI